MTTRCNFTSVRSGRFGGFTCVLRNPFAGALRHDVGSSQLAEMDERQKPLALSSRADTRPWARAVIGYSVCVAAICGIFAGTASGQSGTRTQSGARTQGVTAPGGTGVAVVELFTSQGCSSCPPADNVLRQVHAIAEENDLPVHVLSFHVDYWNRLGWTDPYSDATFTRRQRMYASRLRTNRVYTPQMIVNGTTEFVGSHRSKANTAVARSLRRPAATEIRVRIDVDQSGRNVEVGYDVDESGIGKALNLAVVQSPPQNAVPRGENAGRRLSHVNVVRSFRTISVDKKEGSSTLAIPRGVDFSDARLIAYVQDPQTLAVLGATAIDLE